MPRRSPTFVWKHAFASLFRKQIYGFEPSITSEKNRQNKKKYPPDNHLYVDSQSLDN